MQKLLVTILLMISINVFSFDEQKRAVFPQLTVWPNGADIRIWNHSDKDIQCNGSIYLYTQFGRLRVEFYHQIIRARMNDYRYYPNFFMNDPYRNGHHSIFCYDLN